MNRIVRNILHISGVVLPLITAGQTKEVNKRHQVNVIYILADDLGYGSLGCYGSKTFQTPNIDRLAAEGIRFTQHYAGAPVCGPSRCTLVTGLHNGHGQIRSNALPGQETDLAEGTQTLGTCLKKAGYATAMIGKWGLGMENTTGDPLRQGFDYYCGYLCHVLAHNPYPEYLLENGEKIFLGNKVQYMPKDHWTAGKGSYATEMKKNSQEVFTEKSIQFIEKNKNQPFFLYLTPIIPHDNGEAQSGMARYKMPSYEPYENMPWTENEKGYAANITYLDREVGKIMAKIRELGLEENTLVIFSSDNGADAPDRFERTADAPLKGKKRDMYEGGIRVPFIAYWKGTIAAGRTSTHVSAFWDFLPTVCELAGVKPKQSTDGISYLPELLGKRQKKHESFYFEFYEQEGKQGYIEGDWKLVHLDVLKTTQNPVVELYNIRTDPEEKTNIVTAQPKRVEEMQKRMQKSRISNPSYRFND